MIRRAQFADIPAMAGVLADAHRRSVYADIAAIDVPHAKALLLGLVKADGAPGLGGTIVRVAERNGAITGLIAGVRERVYDLATPDTLRARDLFYLNAGDPRDSVRLLDAFLAWAGREPAVIEAQVSMTDALMPSARTAKLYERRGFARHGLIYRKDMR
jgi:hypothetical protein